MPTVQVMNQVVVELSAEFTKLQEDHDIYLSPTVMEVVGARSLNLQVCDGGVEYKDLEGGVRREFFTIVVGILKVFKVDTTGKYQRYLQDTTESVFATKERVVTTLEGSFLNTGAQDLLVRPLRVISESAVRRGREQGLLIKELRFLGGLNELR